MNLIEEHKLVFIHVPKTGGMNILLTLRDTKEIIDLSRGDISNETLVESLPEPDWAIDVSHNHTRPAREILNIKHNQGWHSFSCVRNPFKRAVSCYYWEKYYLKYFDASLGFDEFIEKEIHQYELFKPCSAWLVDKEGIFVNTIVKTETLRSDMERIYAQIGVQLKPHDFRRKINNNPLYGDLDHKSFYKNRPKAVSKILDYYAQDFEVFKYSRDFNDI